MALLFVRFVLIAFLTMNRPLTLDDKKENDEGDDNHDNNAHNLNCFHTIIFSCAKV